MNLRDHDQKCRHGSKTEHETTRDGIFVEMCHGGAPVDVDVVAGHLSTIFWIPAEVHPTAMQSELKRALEKAKRETQAAIAGEVTL